MYKIIVIDSISNKSINLKLKHSQMIKFISKTTLNNTDKCLKDLQKSYKNIDDILHKKTIVKRLLYITYQTTQHYGAYDFKAVYFIIKENKEIDVIPTTLVFKETADKL